MDKILAPLSVASSDYPKLSLAFFVLGGLTFLKFAVKTLLVFSETFILPGYNLKKFGATKGAWAVVTGASTGIGREYAIQLAKKGFNVLLVARNEQALAAVTDEIDAACKGKVLTNRLILDVAKKDDEAWATLEQTVNSLDIGVLINNVGRSHSHPVYFIETVKEEMDDIVAINISATLRITRMITPGMTQRKRGLILFVGSISAVIPSPMLATYSGSKAFLSTFSTALAAEVKQYGIVVQCLNPYFVVSKLSKIRKPSIMVPTANAFVRASLSKIGSAAGSRFTGRPAGSTPYWSHALLDYFIGCLGMMQASVDVTHNMHRDIRKRVDKKLARESKKQ